MVCTGQKKRGLPQEKIFRPEDHPGTDLVAKLRSQVAISWGLAFLAERTWIIFRQLLDRADIALKAFDKACENMPFRIHIFKDSGLTSPRVFGRPRPWPKLAG